MLKTLITLGRASNLPTVWSNTVAGAVLAGMHSINASFFLVLLAMSLAYTGGMFLNDAFDAKIDSAERPNRPIPSGLIKLSTVYLLGFALLGFSIALVMVAAYFSTSGMVRAASAAVALCVCIVLYNAWHKNNPISPFIMGLCRMLVYIATGLSLVAVANSAVYLGAAITLCYLIGLTYIAKYENSAGKFALWPLAFFAVPVLFGLIQSSASLITFGVTLLFCGWLAYALQFVLNTKKRSIPKAVVSMIAGISLLDAIYISAFGGGVMVIAALLAFGLTLYLQRYVSGT